MWLENVSIFHRTRFTSYAIFIQEITMRELKFISNWKKVSLKRGVMSNTYIFAFYIHKSGKGRNIEMSGSATVCVSRFHTRCHRVAGRFVTYLFCGLKTEILIDTLFPEINFSPIFQYTIYKVDISFQSNCLSRKLPPI